MRLQVFLPLNFPLHAAIILLLYYNLKGSIAFVVDGNDTDRQALLHFKAKIIGDPLGIMHSWNDSVHFCQWLGVTCSRRHQRVTYLDLRNLKLMGSISPYIGNLSFLQVLDLTFNGFTQRVPQEVGRLHRLQELSLSGNYLGGEFPSNISGCSKLIYLFIEHNLLVGEIPAAIGRLSNLNALSFFNNSLSGSIPPFLGNLTSLKVIFLTLNRFTGVIPETLGQLKNLTRLGISTNEVSGTVPSSLFNLSNIKILDIGENDLHGNLPSQLGINMPYLESFYVQTNQLSGPFPLSLTNASNLSDLQVASNKLIGNMPSFGKLEKLQRLVIAINLLGGQGANELNFLCSLTNTTSLQYVDISYNRFGGELPECIGNLSTAITSFATQGNNILGNIPAGIGNLINLEVLALGENQFSGSIPFAIGRLQNLQLLHIDVTSISGGIPISLGNLKMLIKLYLSDNNLQGNIPPSLGECENLVLLDLSNNNLSGSIPPQIGECENLVLLDLSNNNLSGSIPPQIARLRSLSIMLNLSSNRLTGVPPSEVGNLRNLEILDVSHNMLSGVITTSIGDCIMLGELLMRSNFFRGSIPSSLRSLRGLTKLDISSNNLTGEIPEFLMTFGALHYLNLSYNDLEGVVPVNGVFKNKSAVFLEGNSKLCGGSAEFRLPTCDNLKEHRGRSTISVKLIIAIVFVLLGVLFFSFIILFCLRKKRKYPTSSDAENLSLELSYQMILKATNGFSPANLVGKGGFGFVYKGILEENGTVIAVKVLNLLSHGASRSFMAECETLRNIRHRNLVKVLTAISGVDYKGNDFKALIYEFMQNGSSEEWLHPSDGMKEAEGKAKSLNFFQRLNVAVDIVCALEYLHNHCETPIVHCDLKPSNILLDDEMVGHVGDFGLAKFITSNLEENNTASLSSSVGLRGTIGYAPPEYGMGSVVTTYGDVYSFGILILEMFTGRRPTDETFKENINLHNFVKTALPNRVAEVTDQILLQESLGEALINNPRNIGSSRRDGRLLQCLNSVFEIGVACSVEMPTERMNMAVAAAKLCSIKSKLIPTRSRAAGTG